MSFGKRFGIVAAMEELEEGTPVEQEEQIGDDADSAETDLIEATEISADIDAGNDNIDQAAEDVESLDAIADTMEASEENGGMDETAAAIAEVAVEGLYARLGITRKKAMPAMESFGSTSTRVKATKIAVEGIRDMAKKAWEAILKFFQQVQAWVVEFFKKIFDAKTKLRARADKLGAVAAKLEGEAKEAKFEAGSLAKALVTGTEVNPDSIAKALVALGKDVASAGELTKESLAFTSNFTPIVAAISTEEAFNTAVGKLTAFKNDSFKEKAGSGKWYSRKPPEGFAEYLLTDSEVKEIGNTVLVAVAPVTPATGKEALAQMKNIKVRLETKSDGKVPTEVKTATPQQIAAICKAVGEAVDSLDQFESFTKEAEKASKELIDTVKRAAGMTKEDKDAAARAKMIQSALVGAVRLMSGVPSLTSKYTITTAKAALDYSEKSAKQYGGKVEKEAEAAPAKAE